MAFKCLNLLLFVSVFSCNQGSHSRQEFSGTAAVTSSETVVSAKYALQFIRAELAKTEKLTATDLKDKPISLNMIDQGPNDCASLVFGLKNAAIPVADAKITFRTQPDYPVGMKLAARTDPAASETDQLTGKKVIIFTATSNQAGEFIVPVCAGASLGSAVVFGEFLTPDKNLKIKDQSPVIVVASGASTSLNLSLTFNPVNARTMIGFFNTNSETTLAVQAKIGSKGDGNVIADYQLRVSAETGKIVIKNGGFPDPITGLVDFTIQALHMVNYRPYQVTQLGRATLGQTRCDALDIATNYDKDLTYYDLSKNWRSTVVYMIRGAEPYFDPDGSGIVRDDAFGFWDKNQNGVYDEGIDLVTTPGRKYDPKGAWFIDFPTPFIDVNDNGIYEPGIDILLADKYEPPNGKRDSDTIIWKSETFPIYFGTSPYAMLRSRIVHGEYDAIYSKDADDYFTQKYNSGNRGSPNAGIWKSKGLSETIDATSFYGPTASNSEFAYGSTIYRHFFAHDVCGNLLPGGRKLGVNFVVKNPAEFGSRVPTAHFYVQPGDEYLEPARRVLSESNGTDSAVINFNGIDHPSAAAGYPIEFTVKLPSCKNSCTGNVANAGYACDGATFEMRTTSDGDSVGTNIIIPSTVTCTCKEGSTLQKGSCVKSL